MSETKFPGIPMPTTSPEALFRTVMSLKESVELLTGQRGDYVTRVIEDIRAEIAATLAGDRWVQIASVAVTAVPDITVTWAPGAYKLVKAYLVGARTSANTANDLYARIHRGGSVVTGASDYVNQSPYWAGGAGAIYSGVTSFMYAAAGGLLNEPALVELDLAHADAAERPIMATRTRWTNFAGPQHGYGLFSANVPGGSGLLSGFVVGVVGGSLTLAATGQLIVLGLKS